MVVVNAEADQKEIAKKVMKEAGALDSKDLTEKWDSSVWEGFKAVRPPVGS